MLVWTLAIEIVFSAERVIITAQSALFTSVTVDVSLVEVKTSRTPQLGSAPPHSMANLGDVRSAWRYFAELDAQRTSILHWSDARVEHRYCRLLMDAQFYWTSGTVENGNMYTVMPPSDQTNRFNSTVKLSRVVWCDHSCK